MRTFFFVFALGLMYRFIFNYFLFVFHCSHSTQRLLGVVWKNIIYSCMFECHRVAGLIFTKRKNASVMAKKRKTPWLIGPNLTACWSGKWRIRKMHYLAWPCLNQRSNHWSRWRNLRFQFKRINISRLTFREPCCSDAVPRSTSGVPDVFPP